MFLDVLLILICVAKIAAELCENGQNHCMARNRSRYTFNQESHWNSAKTVYQFHANDIHGNDVALKKYEGYVLIIVNVASQCGLTNSNYEKLVEFHEKYGDKGLKILAFPSNQFWGQEPGTPEEIQSFVKRYNVKFDLFEKTDVNGYNAHPLWKWLSTRKDGVTVDITWNFAKFVIDRKGKIVQRFDPSLITGSDLILLDKALKDIFAS